MAPGPFLDDLQPFLHLPPSRLQLRAELTGQGKVQSSRFSVGFQRRPFDVAGGGASFSL